MAPVIELEPYERLVALVGRSPAALAGPAVRLSAIAAVAGFVGGVANAWLAHSADARHALLLGFGLVALLLIIRLVVRPAAKWAGQWCCLTSHRILIGTSRNGPADWSIPYGMITDVRAVRPGVLRLAPTRTLLISTTVCPYPAEVPRVGQARTLMREIEDAAGLARGTVERSNGPGWRS